MLYTEQTISKIRQKQETVNGKGGGGGGEEEHSLFLFINMKCPNEIL